jgi:predicted ATPase/DNA-binding SARP family transcriptional activator
MVDVRVLGPVELADGTSMVRLAPAERTLLAALACRLGERVAVDVLENALWPGQRPPSARKTLQGHVMRLRRALGSSAIVERTGGYRLDPECIDVDASRIPELVAQASEAIRAGRPAEAIAFLREASAMFRGDPYADVPDTALPTGEVQRLDELRSAVAEEIFEAELARGNGQRCISDIEAFVERHPFRERAWAQLMLALYQAGRAADALAAYGRARVMLAAELGLEPGPALQAVQQSILTHDSRLLRDTPIRVSLSPSNLPAALNPIVGRARELAELARLCEDDRLVTVTGIGGIGKTRLAVELAARTIGRYEHGPYFIDLVPIGDADLIPAAVAAVMGVDVGAHDDAMERVRSAIADESVVLIVDNCEHLLPGISELIARLLASSPRLRVVATSRQPLELAGERVWPLDSLVVPPSTTSIEHVRSSESGALFLARLPMNVATRALSIDDIAAVANVCRRLEGMPLALELAAARSRTLSLPELADRLEHSIGELALPGRGASPRHRSMRATLDWGSQLLSPPAQAALRAMNVFAGGCELPAFGAVCRDDGGPPVDELIDELVRTSFVTVDFATEPARYRLLEPIRQYAGELLHTAGDYQARRKRHLRFYSDLAGALAERERETGRVPLEPLLRELGNLRAALDWAAEDSGSADAGLRLASDMYHVWTGGFHHSEGIAHIARLLGSGGGTPAARSAAARCAAIVAGQMGDTERAVALCEQALDEAIADADRDQERQARRILALLNFEFGDITGARRQLAPALPTRGGQLDSDDTRCLVTKARIDLAAADLDDAAAAAREVLTGSFANATWIGTTARWILGQVMFERGDHDLARSWFTDALDVGERLGNTVAVLDDHLDLVFTECAAGRIDEADAHLTAAASLRPDTDHTWDLRFLEAGAELALHRGSPNDAVGLAESAIELANRSTFVHERCLCLRTLGDAQLAAGDADRALSTFQQLIGRAGAAPYPCRVAEGHEGAAASARALGQLHAAHRHLASATEIRQRTRTQRLRRPVIEEHVAELEKERGLNAPSL